jgi:predicted site-specific integrase-resolvase
MDKNKLSASSTITGEIRQMWSRKQVATRCGVHSESVKRWQKAGLLPAYVINCRVVRYAPEDVEKFLEASRIQRAA